MIKQQRNILKIIIQILFLACVLYSANFLFANEVSQNRLIYVLSTAGLLVISYALFYFRHYILSAWLLLLGLNAVFAVATITNQIFNTPALGGFLLVVTLSGMLRGTIGALFSALIASAVVSRIAYLEIFTPLVPPTTVASPVVFLVTYISYFFVLAFLVGLVFRKLKKTIEDVELEKKNRQTTEEQLKKNQAKLNIALTAGKIGVWEWSIKSNRLIWNNEVIDLLKINASNKMTSIKSFLRIIVPVDRKIFLLALQQALRQIDFDYKISFRIFNQSREILWVDARGRLYLDEENKPDRLIGTVINVTESKLAEEKLRQNEESFRQVFELGLIGMAVTSLDKRWLMVNNRLSEILGYSREELLQLNWADITHAEDLHLDEEKFQQVLQGKINGYTIEKRYLRKDKTSIDTEIAVRCIRKPNGQVDHFLAFIQDITHRKEAITKLKHTASHDFLTDLPNRQYIKESIEVILLEDLKNNKFPAFFLIDLDGFKEINDALGHDIGDEVIKTIAERLKNFSKSHGAIPARIGGDEFGLYFSDITNAQIAENMAVLLVRNLMMPCKIDSMSLEIQASVGIALAAAEQNNDIHDLLRRSDVAMYAAKRKNKLFMFYSTEEDPHTERRIQLLSDLGNAIKNRQFYLMYQPIVSVKDLQIIGYEALLRWNHPTLGNISPAEFISLVETSNYIRPLTNMVLETAIDQGNLWKKMNQGKPISVNISVKNLLDEDFTDTLRKILDKEQFPGSLLQIEITESAFLHDPDRATRAIEQLAGLGVQFSIDDFGTGYSSLYYLAKLPIQSLKIDLSFVQRMLENPRDKVIVDSTIRMAHGLGMKVVAEGVENKETLDELQIIRCDLVQGFYISKPIHADDITK